MNKPFSLIVTDTSPLFTLVLADSLDVLLRPGLAVSIPDAIYIEAACVHSAPGAEQIMEWINAHVERCYGCTQLVESNHESPHEVLIRQDANGTVINPATIDRTHDARHKRKFGARRRRTHVTEAFFGSLPDEISKFGKVGARIGQHRDLGPGVWVVHNPKHPSVIRRYVA